MMPLLRELSDEILENGKMGKMLPSELSGRLRRDVESALSYLVQPKPWLGQAEHLRHRALYLEFSHALAVHLTATVETVVELFLGDSPSWLVDLIRKWHRSRATVLTLNYDTLIEEVACDVAGNDSGDCRLIPQTIYPTFLTDARTRSDAILGSDPIETFSLLKLHGSINWFFSGRDAATGETIYYLPPTGAKRRNDTDPRREIAQARSTVADKYPLIVPPIFDKGTLLTHESIRSLWFKGAKALQQAKRVFVVGYSLPSSDLTMCEFLRANINQSARIEVVDHDPQVATKIAERLELPADRISCRFAGENCVERFVRELNAESKTPS